MTIKLLEHTKINNYAINLIDDKLLLYRLIYSLKLVELKTLKIYIKNNLANGFIKPLKLSLIALILFIKKPDISLCSCVNYQSLNNLTIKTKYLLSLIDKFLHLLDYTKQFM